MAIIMAMDQAISDSDRTNRKRSRSVATYHLFTFRACRRIYSHSYIPGMSGGIIICARACSSNVYIAM